MRWNYWSWKKFISMENIKEINKKIKTHSVDKKDVPSSSKKTSSVKFIKYNTIKKYLNNSLTDLYDCNEKHFGSHLHEFPEDTLLFYNIYDKGNEYQWHVDANDENDDYDIKFTVIINLSDTKYEGGEFKIWCLEKPQTVRELNNPGDMIMLRSYHLHKVTPVIKGTRKSLLMFLMGPPLQ